MTYGINDKVFIVGVTVIFLTVVIGGVFASEAMSIWLKNRREARFQERKMFRIRCDEKSELERNRWIELLKEKDARICSLTNELMRTNRNYDILNALLKSVNLNLDIKESDTNEAD